MEPTQEPRPPVPLSNELPRLPRTPEETLVFKEDGPELMRGGGARCWELTKVTAFVGALSGMGSSSAIGSIMYGPAKSSVKWLVAGAALGSFTGAVGIQAFETSCAEQNAKHYPG